MALDPSIPLQIKQPEQANPLTQMGQYAAISNALAQNKLIGQSTKNAETQGQQLQQNLNTQGANRIAQQTAALMAVPDGQLTPDTIKGVIQSEVQAGTVPKQVADTWMQSVDSVGGDPTALRKLLTAHLVGTLAGPEQMKAVFGVNSEQSNGQTLQNGVTLPPNLGGGFLPTTSTSMLLPPTAKASQIPTIGANNQPGTVPLSAVVDDQGNPRQQGGGGMGDGRYPGGGAQEASAAPAGPPGFNPTGMAPGKQRAQEAAAVAAADAGNKLAGQADAARTQMAQLDNLSDDLAKMQATGPGSGRLALANAIAQKYGGFGLTMTPEELASTESFTKVAKQIAMAQAGSLGAGTDEKLMTAMGANPNLDLSKLGNTQIVAMLKGNSAAIMAKNQAWQAYQAKNGPDSYNQFQTEFNKTFDPRAYQWNYLAATMTPEQRQSYIQSLPDKGKGLRDAYNRAVADGLLKPYGQ